MKARQEYTIPFKGLKEGRHSYSFGISEKFFEDFPAEDVRVGELTATVDLLRRSTFMELDISIHGTVEVVCDRCLEYYQQPVNVEEQLYIHFGDTWEEESESTLVIPFNESQIDMGQFFYEFIMLALPYRRVHPDDSHGHSTCDAGMLEKLNRLTVHEDNPPVNPLRDKLKNSNLNL